MIGRDRKDRKAGVPLPWITAKGGLDYLRATVKEIVRAAKLRDDLSFAPFRYGGFSEAADADLTSGRRFFIFADGPEHLCPSQEGVAHDRLLVPIQPEPGPRR